MLGPMTETTRPSRSKGKAAAPGFTAEERAAMRERAREAKAAGKGRDGEAEVLSAIARMAEADRAVAERLHRLIRANAPSLTPRLWYGMPAYARGDKVVCFFQAAQKFKTRYATLGFSDRAALDDGAIWPTAYAVTGLSDDVETAIAALIRRAAG